jgi:hypothetical protein
MARRTNAADVPLGTRRVLRRKGLKAAIEREQNKVIATDLILGGRTENEVCKALGVHHDTVRQFIYESLVAIVPAAPAREKWLVLLARLEKQHQIYFEKSLKGETESTKVALQIHDRIKELYQFAQRSDLNILVDTPLSANSDTKPIRFVDSNGRVVDVTAALGQEPKAIEHRPIEAEPVNTTTVVNTESVPSGTRYDDPAFTDAGKFAERRLEQLDFERQMNLIEQRDRLRVEVAKVKVGPAKHRDAMLGGDELRGDCSYAEPKKRSG